MKDLTIVTSCVNYGRYLADWATSITRQTVKPGAVCILTHGTGADANAGKAAKAKLDRLGIPVRHRHSPERLDLGVARNQAVAMSETEWVMHLDADDTLLPNAIAQFEKVAPDADIIQAGYLRAGLVSTGPQRKSRLYKGADGLKALDLPAICSGISPFRRSLWERSPYRTDMLGAWDTALWIGFARLGARFRPTPGAVFNYVQHSDSVFNSRRRIQSWARMKTSAQLKALRRNEQGVTVIIPLAARQPEDRAQIWNYLQPMWAREFPDWTIREGLCKQPSWSKGEAITDALSRTSADILVIADADVWVTPDAVRAAVASVAAGVPWVVPHNAVLRLTPVATREILDRSASIYDEHPLERVAYPGVMGGGMIVMKRVHYDAMGGIPRAFRGWGQEDQCLGLMCQTLLGAGSRLNGTLLHLHHAPNPLRGKPQGNTQLLAKLGTAAQGGPDSLVRALLTMPSDGASATKKRPGRKWHERIQQVQTRVPLGPARVGSTFLKRKPRRPL